MGLEHSHDHCQVCAGQLERLSRKLAVFESWLAFLRIASPIALGIAGLLIGRLL